MFEYSHGQYGAQSAGEFFNDFTAIVSEDLARSITNYAQRPNKLEAVFFKFVWIR
jgi:hypothetical protein